MNIDKHVIIEAMTQFAVSTPHDRASVLVSRVAARLQAQGEPFEPPLDRCEVAVVRNFIPRSNAPG